MSNIDTVIHLLLIDSRGLKAYFALLATSNKCESNLIDGCN